MNCSSSGYVPLSCPCPSGFAHDDWMFLKGGCSVDKDLRDVLIGIIFAMTCVGFMLLLSALRRVAKKVPQMKVKDGYYDWLKKCYSFGVVGMALLALYQAMIVMKGMEAEAFVALFLVEVIMVYHVGWAVLCLATPMFINLKLDVKRLKHIYLMGIHVVVIFFVVASCVRIGYRTGMALDNEQAVAQFNQITQVVLIMLAVIATVFGAIPFVFLLKFRKIYRNFDLENKMELKPQILAQMEFMLYRLKVASVLGIVLLFIFGSFGVFALFFDTSYIWVAHFGMILSIVLVSISTTGLSVDGTPHLSSILPITVGGKKQRSVQTSSGVKPTS